MLQGSEPEHAEPYTDLSVQSGGCGGCEACGMPHLLLSPSETARAAAAATMAVTEHTCLQPLPGQMHASAISTRTACLAKTGMVLRPIPDHPRTHLHPHIMWGEQACFGSSSTLPSPVSLG